MKNTKFYLFNNLAFILICLFLSSCKNYYITVDSFKQQFADVNLKREKSNYSASGNTILTGQQYDIVPLKKIRCTDKKGNPHELLNGPSIETRFTYIPNGKTKSRRTVFYFDTIIVTDSTVSGFRSRFFGMRKSILLDSIKKIEVQNGGKKFRYVNN